MGAWGAGSFDNDDASDWVWELEKADDSQVLRKALERVTRAGQQVHLVPSVCAEAVAAAEVVAALLGQPAPELPDEVVTWVDAHRGRHEPSLAPTALQAIERIRADSELSKLWKESGAEEWHTELADLERRLKA